MADNLTRRALLVSTAGLAVTALLPALSPRHADPTVIRLSGIDLASEPDETVIAWAAPGEFRLGMLWRDGQVIYEDAAWARL